MWPLRSSRQRVRLSFVSVVGYQSQPMTCGSVARTLPCEYRHRHMEHRSWRLIASGSIVDCALAAQRKGKKRGSSWAASLSGRCAHALRALRSRISPSVTLGSSQAARAIRTAALGGGCPPSTGGLSTSSSPTALQGSRRPGRVHLGGRFPLRCVQRLSPPAVATRRCTWRCNRDTSGPSGPVLSY